MSHPANRAGHQDMAGAQPADCHHPTPHHSSSRKFMSLLNHAETVGCIVLDRHWFAHPWLLFPPPPPMQSTPECSVVTNILFMGLIPSLTPLKQYFQLHWNRLQTTIPMNECSPHFPPAALSASSLSCSCWSSITIVEMLSSRPPSITLLRSKLVLLR